jgi:hypothetical protein
MSLRKPSLPLAVGACLLGAWTNAAGNLIVNGDFSTGDLTGWTTTLTAPATITPDASEGNPSGSALLARNDTAASANGNILLQAIPVTPGRQYKLTADWKGDLLNGGSGRNWAEVMVSFAADPSATPDRIVYKKATDGGPNALPMPWDWESILLSPVDGSAPLDGVFTATDNYMLVGFNLGGRDLSRNNTQPGFYAVDNVSVHPVYPAPVLQITRTTVTAEDLSVEGRNGPPNGTYQVLRSINLGPDPEDWTQIEVEAFDPDGAFAFTTALTEDPASFFQVSVLSSSSTPVISVQPQDVAARTGDTVGFAVTVEGYDPLSYQWYRNTDTLLEGETASILTLVDVQPGDAGEYSVRITNRFGEVSSVAAALSVTDEPEEQLAFPQAEGYGKYTVGGRGGVVYEVTHLNDSGVGSLRAAVEASGPRTVVFRVSGTINLTRNLKISHPNITIAGQTAPGDGICLKRYTLEIDADEVIIRYLRVRFGDETKNDADAVSMRYHRNIILDHVSASWGDDETLSLYHGENVTVQWCIIAETLNRGGVHGFGGIWGSPSSTFHHNLVAHNVSRNMRFASGCGNTDYRNNVIYNWGYNSAYGGEKQQVGNPTFNDANINMVNNYYKPGPGTSASVASRIVNPSYRDVKTDYGKFYVAGNYVVGNPTVTADNWNGGVNPAGGSGDIPLVKLEVPWPAMAINEQTAEEAYLSVLSHVGCSKPVRDSLDARLVNEVSTGTATYGLNGVIESQSEVGGWPTLNSTEPPVDTDHDGMPDEWETARGLLPLVAADRNLYTLDPLYTNLEVYLNELGAF